MKDLSMDSVFQLTRDTLKNVGNDEITLEAGTLMRVVEIRNGHCYAVRHHTDDSTVYAFCDSEHEILDGPTCAEAMPPPRGCKAYFNGEQSRGMHAAIDALPLTADQQNVLGALKEFVSAGMEKCFLLQGYAGTGKTFLIRRFVQWLQSEKMGFMLSAPTGRAGKVLAEKTGYPAGTIHRSIYGMDRLLEIPGAKEEDRFKFYYGLKLIAPDERPRVIVVDESSMVSDREDDEKFLRFGSGRLLKDLLEFAGEKQGDSRCQVVFVGDPAQLPPIGMDISPALDAEYLKKEFGVESRRAALRQVVRQEGNSAILKAAERIRADIEARRENRLEICPDAKELIEIDSGQVVDLWEKTCPKDREPDLAPPLICVTWRNKTALEFNVSVRARLHGQGDGMQPVQARDYLMIVCNNYKTGLWNGELALVKSAAEKNEIRTVGIRSKEGLKRIELAFRQVTLAVPCGGGSVSAITCMILENVLFGRERDLTEDEQIALWVDFKNRNPGLLPRTDEFKLALAADPYFHALRVKFGYAVTCHKAQGGEWPTAIVVFERQRPVLENLRWAYTAITRAKNTLFGIGFPRRGIINWEAVSETNVDPPNSDESKAEESTPDLEAFHRAGFPPELDGLARLHFAAVSEWAGCGIEMEKAEPCMGKWFVRYQLFKAGQRVWLQYSFNKKMKTVLVDVRALTSPTPVALVEECRRGFLRAQETVASVCQAKVPAPAELRELREEHVGPAAVRLGGMIHGVESLPYRERYRIRSANGGQAVLDFCYDGKHRFTRRPEIHPDTTDFAFAQTLIGELRP